MALTYKNIQFIKERTVDGTTYGLFVKLTTESRDYAIYRDGKTVVDQYDMEALPKTVQQFIKTHTPEAWSQNTDRDGQVFTTYIYR